jgi:hypothetical protein
MGPIGSGWTQKGFKFGFNPIMYLINPNEPDFGLGWAPRVQIRIDSGWAPGVQIWAESGWVSWVHLVALLTGLSSERQ